MFKRTSHFNCVTEVDFDCGPVNAFGREDVEAFGTVLDDFEAHYPAARILLLTSHKVSPKGKPIFCAGADQKERHDWSRQAIIHFVDQERAIVNHLRQLPHVVVSYVDGYALGLGAELTLASDYVIAGPQARFGFPEASLGIIPGAGGTTWGAQASRQAFSHLLVADHFGREEAVKCDLVNACVEDETAMFRILERFSERLSHTDPQSQSALKRARARAYFDTHDDQIEHSAYQFCLSKKSSVDFNL